MRRVRKGSGACERAHDNRALPALRNPEVRSVENLSPHRVPAASRGLFKSLVLGRVEQLRNILHKEDSRLDLVQGSQVLPPQTSSLPADAVPVQGGETLARRSSDNYIREREVSDVFNPRAFDVVAKVDPIGGSRILIEFYRADGNELTGRLKASTQAPTSGK